MIPNFGRGPNFSNQRILPRAPVSALHGSSLLGAHFLFHVAYNYTSFGQFTSPSNLDYKNPPVHPLLGPGSYGIPCGQVLS